MSKEFPIFYITASLELLTNHKIHSCKVYNSVEDYLIYLGILCSRGPPSWLHIGITCRALKKKYCYLVHPQRF